ELNRWKNGQQFDLPSWITPTMKFVTISNLSKAVPIAKRINKLDN
ncbi:2643_t:CDS:1, partial [Acaulospora morrowiae]